MKTFKKIIKITGLFLLVLGLICFIYAAKTNNTAYLVVDNYETSGQAGMKKLDEMIKDAWLDRQFFEVIVYPNDRAPFCLHYHMGLKALSISTDLHSGWDGSFKLTLEEFDHLSRQNYSTDNLLFSVIWKYPRNNDTDLESRREGILRFF